MGGGDVAADPDPSGAFAEMSQRAGGQAALWAAFGCFVAMALWRLVETFLGRVADGEQSVSLFQRVSAFSLAVINAGLGYLAFRYATGQGVEDGEAVAFTGRLMQTTAGSALLLIVGLVVVGVGVGYIYKGANRKFIDDLVGRAGGMLRKLGIAGYVGKGLVILMVGILVLVATARSQPEEAAGLDAALRTLAAQPFGPILLYLAASGMAIFGVFSLAMVWRAKM